MIDHLVYLVHDLEEAASKLGKTLGVAFSPGGRHLSRGTKNLLLRIGPSTYLELMAIDHENASFVGKRWMGADHLSEEVTGSLSRWGLQVDGARLESGATILDRYIPGAGQIQPGSRRLANGKTLRWQLTDPGTEALRPLPFMIDWCGAPCPAKQLPEVGCQLESLQITSARSIAINFLCYSNPKVTTINASQVALRAEIVGLAGSITLTN